MVSGFDTMKAKYDRTPSHYDAFLIDPRYLVVIVEISPHSRDVGEKSVERLKIQHFWCIMINSTMVLLLPVRIGIL